MIREELMSSKLSWLQTVKSSSNDLLKALLTAIYLFICCFFIISLLKLKDNWCPQRCFYGSLWKALLMILWKLFSITFIYLLLFLLLLHWNERTIGVLKAVSTAVCGKAPLMNELWWIIFISYYLYIAYYLLLLVLGYFFLLLFLFCLRKCVILFMVVKSHIIFSGNF